MILRSNMAEAVRSLSSAKQRTLLALIGIVIGIGSVIAMVSVGKIVQEEAVRQFREMGTDLLTIEKVFGGAGPAGGSGGRRSAVAPVKLQEAVAIPAKCPGIGTVSPMVYVTGSGEVNYAGRKIEQTSVVGVTETFCDINKLRVAQGRFVSDLDEQSRYCVIGNGIYQELLKRGTAGVIGDKIRCGEAILTVIGVLESVPPGGMRRFEPDQTICIPITTGLRMTTDPGISLITARVRAGVATATAQGQVVSYFAALKKQVRVTSPEEVIAQMEKQMQMFTLLLGAIGSISLIVGGVGVMNVMLVSVTERRREIGIRRALGAKRGDIKGQFLIESIILSLVGGFFGILLGVGAARVISHFAHWQFMLSGGAILLGVGVSTAVGVFFGFYPARQASLLDPIVALRSE